MSTHTIPSNKRQKRAHPHMSNNSHTGTRDNPILVPASPSPSPPLSPIPLHQFLQHTPPEFPSQDSDLLRGRPAWKRDFDECARRWRKAGELVGFCGMVGRVKNFKRGDMDDSAHMAMSFDDIEGDQRRITLNVVFNDVNTYPLTYSVLLYSDDTLPRNAEKALSRFSEIHNMELDILFSRILSALQGDDTANGGQALIETPGQTQSTNLENEDGLDEGEMPDFQESLDGPVGGPFDKNGERPPDWTDLKLHFEQAKAMGYRPGLTRVSDFWMISLSIPLKNLGIDINTLAIWDDGLVDAWKTNKRLMMLIRTSSYPLKLDEMVFYLGVHQNYKPSPDEMLAATRGTNLPSFYPSEALTIFLKSFPLAYKARTAFSVDWSQADASAFDPDLTTKVFHHGEMPPGQSVHNPDDPVVRGFESNLPVVAFWWILRRFVLANKYCLKCGLEVETPSLRPYVCDKPLCLWAFMSLGLGPSVEHVIIQHPSVVDVLITFAHTAATSTMRMDLPLGLNIELPTAFGLAEPTEFDNIAEDKQREALRWLIERLPKVSSIKASLQAGIKLHQLGVPSGSIGVLRWIVGSCRAYLKEVKPGEGVLQPDADSSALGFKQFVFVVGSPAQEANFKSEIDKAKLAKGNAIDYPSLLAFHGSTAARWHNILRTGLDFQERPNGRAYGDGVYFASQYETSLGYCSVHTSTPARSNADFAVSSAIAVVELVNVPDTFVSRTPYYVVNQTHQIKPFLLLVAGKTESATSTTVSDGELFKHDPSLAIQPTFKGGPLRVKMPRKLEATPFADLEPDDEEDDAIFGIRRNLFIPSPASRFDRLQKMQPPSSTSVIATKALGKAFKEIIKVQDEGKLPFYVHPDTESLYCWTLELHGFADSQLKTEMKQLGIHSVITEVRFPEAFPFSPPFMRILHPRFKPFMQGGGGNITAGGSICNEVLTSAGWTAACSIEGVVISIMANMTEADPPARIDMASWDRPYNLSEAMEAYKRVANTHGWEIPKDFDRIGR